MIQAGILAGSLTHVWTDWAQGMNSAGSPTWAPLGRGGGSAEVSRVPAYALSLTEKWRSSASRDASQGLFSAQISYLQLGFLTPKSHGYLQGFRYSQEQSIKGILAI